MKKISWNNIVPHLVAVVVFLLVAVVYCSPALQGKVLQQSDVVHWKGMAQSSFEYKETHGHFPLWINSMFGGMPGYTIAMDSENPVSIGIFHKIFTLFLPEPISFFFLLCIGFYFLTQVFKVDYRLGILGALGYAYASFIPIIVTVGHVTQVLAMGYVPAMLGAMFLVFQKKYWSGAALSTLFASLLISMNHPQITYYLLLTAVFVVIVYGIQWIREKEIKHMLVSAGILLGASVVALCINMITLATTYDYSKATMRGGSEIIDTATNGTKKSTGLPIDYAFNWSYSPTETFTLLVPDVYGGGSSGGELDNTSAIAKQLSQAGVPEEQLGDYAAQFPTYWGQQPNTAGPVYLGAAFFLLFIFGLFYLKGKDRWWVLAACVLGIVMSWGKNFMAVNEFLFNYLPFYNKFRAPSMSLVIPQLLFPFLGVLALQQLFVHETNKAAAFDQLKKAGYAIAAFFLIAVMLYLSFDYTGENDKMILSQMTGGNEEATKSFVNALKSDRQSLFGKDLLRSLFFAGTVMLLLWAFIKNKIKTGYAMMGIVLLASVDLLAAGRRFLNANSFQEPVELDANYFTPSQADQVIMQDTGYYRVFNLTQDVFNDALTSYFHNSVGGYHPAKLSITEDLLNYQLRKQPLNIQVLNMLNTKYVIVPGPQNQPVVQQNPEALGPCWFVKSIDFEKGPNEAMQRISNFSPRDTAIVEESFKAAIPFMPVADSIASIRLIKNDNDIVTYQSSAATNQFAVFSEIYYASGWKAYIDDKEAPIVKTNYVLRGLAVPAGNHTIRFEFRPASYYDSSKFAIAGSAIAWLVIIAALVHWYRKQPLAA